MLDLAWRCTTTQPSIRLAKVPVSALLSAGIHGCREFLGHDAQMRRRDLQRLIVGIAFQLPALIVTAVAVPSHDISEAGLYSLADAASQRGSPSGLTDESPDTKRDCLAQQINALHTVASTTMPATVNAVCPG